MVSGMDSLIGCLLITHLPVKAELARRPELAGRPVIVCGGDMRRRVVTDAAPEAQAAGARAGQPLTEALSRCAGAVALPADDRHLSEVNDAMLASLLEVADRVEQDGLGEFYLDLTGLAPMYGGETVLASAILAAIDAAWQPRLGLAAGKFPAYCAAASAKPGEWLKAPTDAARWLAPWPVSWLPLPQDALFRMTGFGIRTLGDIAALTPDALSDFLGRVGERAWQLSQGVDTEPVHPAALPEVLRERLEFPFPVDTVPGWEAGVRALSERVWGNPALRRRGATEILLEGETDAGVVWRFHRVLPRPAASAEGLSAALLAPLNAQDSRGRGRWPDAALLDLSLTVSGPGAAERTPDEPVAYGTTRRVRAHGCGSGQAGGVVAGLAPAGTPLGAGPGVPAFGTTFGGNRVCPRGLPKISWRQAGGKDHRPVGSGHRMVDAGALSAALLANAAVRRRPGHRISRPVCGNVAPAGWLTCPPISWNCAPTPGFPSAPARRRWPNWSRGPPIAATRPWA